MPPKTQKKTKSQNIRALQDTRKSNAIEADDLINDFEEEIEPEVEEEEYIPPQPVKQKAPKQNKMEEREYQELLNYRLEQARIKKQQQVEKKRQQEQQYLETIKQQQEKELQKKLKRLANKQKKEIEKDLMNKYLNQIQQQPEEEEYYEEEIQEHPIIYQQSHNRRGGGGSSAPPAAPAYRGPRFF